MTTIADSAARVLLWLAKVSAALDRYRGGMPLSIDNPETDRLARELAAATGESITAAVATALRERLERVRASSRSDDRRSELTVIAQRVAVLPVLDDHPEAEVLGYGDDGLPA